MFHCIIELPDVFSIKEKRRIVKSLLDRLRRKFRVSAAEVDLHDSLAFTEIGAALVSNSREYGEKVMQKVLMFIEDEVPGRVQDASIHSESWD